jgi:hypothetical protein
MFVGMVVAFLFGTWLAGKVGCPGPQVEPQASSSLVHRFRNSNKA